MRGAFRRWAFPAQPRPLPHGRWPSIALRSIHLAAFSILLGGHVLGAEPALLRPYLSVTVLSGVGLLALEAYGAGLYWLFMGKGLMVLGKLGLLLLIPLFWEARVVLLLLAVVVASVGSHMPARYRNAMLLPHPHPSTAEEESRMPTHPRCTAFAVAIVLSGLALGLWRTPALAGDAARLRANPLVGRKLYMTYCYTCHGVTGRGDGPAARELAIKPRNLTDDAYMSARSDQDLYSVISGGSAAIHRFSEMPAWKAFLYHERIWDLIAYIRTLHRPRAAPGQPAPQPGDVERGKRLYADYCAVCHGREGRGDGPVTMMFGPRPFDFTDAAGMAAKQDADLYFAIFGGGEAIGKSAYMPRWGGLLQDQEMWDVIAYLRTLPRPR